MRTREPLSDLAAIVAQINTAAQDRSRLGALLNALGEVEIFDSVVAFGTKETLKHFIAFDARGDCASSREWKRWPLRRLFDTMLVRRISHPQTATWALAIPLEYGIERIVVLATLSSWAYANELEPFFKALENFCVPRCASRVVVPEDIPLAPIEPRVVSLALCPSRNEVVDQMLRRRGWCTRLANDFRMLRALLESARPDVIFLDLEHQVDPLQALLRLHTVLTTPTKVIAFGDGAYRSWERQTLVDEVIAHDAGEEEIFGVLKRFAREVPELRRTRLREMTSGLERALRESRTPADLSVLGARHAAEVMLGWASMHLVTENGTTFASEYPKLSRPVLTAIPKVFLSDEPFFQIHADERFYREVSDDRRVVGALERLHPISAAGIPLHHGDRRIGTLISVSQNVCADSSAFQALEEFAKITTRRFEEFVQPLPGPETQRNGIWEWLHHGTLEFAAYRSRGATMVWDYLAVRTDLGLLVVGDRADVSAVARVATSWRSMEQRLSSYVEEHAGSERVFVAACDPIASTVTYAARGFPVPLLFDTAGPAGTLSARGSVVAGTITIVPPAGLLVWNARLARWLARETPEVQSVTETLEDLRPPGVAIVVTAAR